MARCGVRLPQSLQSHGNVLLIIVCKMILTNEPKVSCVGVIHGVRRLDRAAFVLGRS